MKQRSKSTHELRNKMTGISDFELPVELANTQQKIALLEMEKTMLKEDVVQLNTNLDMLSNDFEKINHLHMEEKKITDESFQRIINFHGKFSTDKIFFFLGLYLSAKNNKEEDVVQAKLWKQKVKEQMQKDIEVIDSKYIGTELAQSVIHLNDIKKIYARNKEIDKVLISPHLKYMDNFTQIEHLVLDESVKSYDHIDIALQGEHPELIGNE